MKSLIPLMCTRTPNKPPRDPHFWFALLSLAMWISACGRPPSEHASSVNSGLTDTEKQAMVEKMATEYKQDYPDVAELSVPELVNRMTRENIFLVDVRTEPEQAVSMIPGAVPRSLFENEKGEHKDQTIVTYCTIGYRSGKYALELQGEGFKVYNLRGSMLAWAHAHRPVVNPSGIETWRVHVYGPKWDLLPAGYTPVW